MAGRVLTETAAASERIDWSAAVEGMRPCGLRRADPVPAAGRHADGQDRGRDRPPFPLRLGPGRGRAGRRRTAAPGRHAHGPAGDHRRRDRPARARPGAARAVRDLRDRGRHRARLRAAVPAVREPLRGRHRHHGVDLRDARLGAEHRGRARRPARPRLRRLLCGRRLLLRAVRAMARARLLAMPADGRRARGLVRGPARLPGACACAATISRS